MAIRKAVTSPTINTDLLISLFVMVESYDSTKENPTDLPDMLEESELSEAELYANLGILEDAELLKSAGRFTNSAWWIAVPDVSADNAEAVAREALANFTPEAPEPATKAVKPTATPKPQKAPEPKPEATQTGLTREQVAKEVKTVKLEIPQNDVNFPDLITELRKAHETASNDPTNYVVPDETDLPVRPDGVNENTWYMAHNAYSNSEKSTLSARLFWMERAQSQTA